MRRTTLSVQDTDIGLRPRGASRPSAQLLEQLGMSEAAPGARMRLLRRARGLTQDDLARAAGVSRSAVAQWETGRAGFGNRIVRLAHVLGVTARELRTASGTALEAEGGRLSRDEVALLDDFRELAAADRACILLLARRLAAASGA